MRRDLIIAMSFAAAFHGIVLFGFNRKEVVDNGPVVEIELAPEDKKEEPPVEELEPEPDDAPAEDLPNIEQFADAIAEPPSGVVEAGAITQYVRPTPPRPPRPPGMNQIGVPTAVAGGGGGKQELIFDASQLDSPVRAKYQPSPTYPPELKRLGVTGMVVVTFIIDTKGRVREPQLVSATDPAMGKSVLDTVVKWRFDPPLKNGKPVQARYRQPIPFTLNK